MSISWETDNRIAFGESEINLLTTLANSMSVALENARLFEETNRLLEETRQRNAEIGSHQLIQQGLASQLDMQAIFDLLGDKSRQSSTRRGDDLHWPNWI